MKLELGLPAAGLQHLELPEADAVAHAGADGLGGRFLGGEPDREMGQRILVPAAIGQLGLGEQPPLHARAEALEGFAHALHLDHVDADAANRHMISRWANVIATRVGPAGRHSTGHMNVGTAPARVKRLSWPCRYDIRVLVSRGMRYARPTRCVPRAWRRRSRTRTFHPMSLR